MTLNGPVLLVLLVGGLLAGYFILRSQMSQQMAELRKMVETGQNLGALAVRAPEPVAATPPTPTVEVSKPKPEVPKEQPKPVVLPKAEPVKEEITAEVLAVIAAAVAQFVGAGARIRSTRMLPIPEGNAWAQQGRVIIQASHNLAMR
jgi:outer membrane biosynthesis protein TonB